MENMEEKTRGNKNTGNMGKEVMINKKLSNSVYQISLCQKIVATLVKKYCTFFFLQTRWFISIFPKSHHPVLSQVRRVVFTPSHSFLLRLSVLKFSKFKKYLV